MSIFSPSQASSTSDVSSWIYDKTWKTGLIVACGLIIYIAARSLPKGPAQDLKLRHLPHQDLNEQGEGQRRDLPLQDFNRFGFKALREVTFTLIQVSVRGAYTGWDEIRKTVEKAWQDPKAEEQRILAGALGGLVLYGAVSYSVSGLIFAVFCIAMGAFVGFATTLNSQRARLLD